MFSKTCEYAIRATIYIGKQSKDGSKIRLPEIAENTNSPVAFTAKILQVLVKNDIISSTKGPNGGFSISKSQEQKVALIDIVKAIDGESTYNGCGLGLKECSEKKPCPIHFHFKEIRENLKNMLANTSINQLIDKLDKGETFLRI